MIVPFATMLVVMVVVVVVRVFISMVMIMRGQRMWYEMKKRISKKTTSSKAEKNFKQR
jgi:hypothetical protein